MSKQSTFQILRDEGNKVIDRQFEAATDIDNKAYKNSRLTILILGTLLTIFSLSTKLDSLSPEILITNQTLLGLILLITSAIISVYTYSTDKFYFGIGSSDIDMILDSDWDEETLLNEISKNYSKGIGVNETQKNLKSDKFLYSQLMLILSIIFISGGIITSISEIHYQKIVAIEALASLVTAYFFYSKIQKVRITWALKRIRERLRRIVAMAV